jgi:hypothetical protein
LSDATVFSETRRVVFAEPVTGAGLAEALHRFMVALGEPLSYKGVILGHIKVMAVIPASGDFLFLSMTRLDRVDTKASPTYPQGNHSGIDSVDLTINILLFGCSRGTVERGIDTALALIPMKV